MMRFGSSTRLVLAAAMLISPRIHLSAAEPAETNGDLPVLKFAGDVRRLPVHEAKRGYPVRLRGVVTYVDPGSGSSGQLFMQDATAGIFVFRRSRFDSSLHTGQLVEVTGVTTAGDFSPCVGNAEIRPLGEASLPPPKSPIFERLLATREDGQWSELSGVVRSGQTKGERLFLNVATVGGSFLAVLPRYPVDWRAAFVDSRVTVRGALAPIRNENRQAVGVRLFVPGPAFIRIDEAAPANPFDRPPSSAASVGQFSPQAEPELRIRVRATITAFDPGGAIYISDGRGNLEVQASPPCSGQPGDQVDVVGFPGTVDGRPGLQDSVCRKVAGGQKAEPVPVKAADVLSLQNFSDPSGSGQAVGMRYDAKLVRIGGVVLQTSRVPAGYNLIIESGNRDFLATLPSAAGGSRPPAENGSRLLLTGVCLVTYDQYHRGQSFRILLRDATDIVVVSSPPWFSLKYAFWCLCVATAMIFAASTWIWSLRHRVARDTQELRQANETLQRLSSQDGLTGAANRRQFDQRLEAEFAAARRSGQPLSLLLLDIDDFKALNDRYGHQTGDECLISLARALETVSSRAAGLVARYGGEEFAVVLPNTDHANALHIAEGMRGAVAALQIPGASTSSRCLSVSLGVATLRPEANSSPARLIADADQNLYQAKLLGKNRCFSAESMPDSGSRKDAETIARVTNSFC